jgi:hypothetical protein
MTAADFTSSITSRSDTEAERVEEAGPFRFPRLPLSRTFMVERAPTLRIQARSRLPRDSRSSRPARQEVGVSLQVQQPALMAGDTVTHALPAFAVPLQLSVLDVNASPLWRLCGEAHLPLTGLTRIGPDCHRGLMFQLRSSRCGGS